MTWCLLTSWSLEQKDAPRGMTGAGWMPFVMMPYYVAFQPSALLTCNGAGTGGVSWGSRAQARAIIAPT